MVGIFSGLWLLALLALVLADEELVAGSTEAASLLDRSKARLRMRAAALGAALKAELKTSKLEAEAELKASKLEAEAELKTSKLEAEAWPDWKEARELLQREAAYLAAEDDLAAALLHNFARSVLPTLLLAAPGVARTSPLAVAATAPLVPPVAEPSPEAPASPFVVLESTEMLVQKASSGGRVRTTRYCRERACVSRSEELAPGEDAPVLEGSDSLNAEDVLDPAKWLSLSANSQEAWIGLSGTAQEETGQELSSESADMFVLDGPQVLTDRQDTDDVDPLDVAVTAAVDLAGSSVREAARTLAREMKEAAETYHLAPTLDVLGQVLRNKLPKALLGGHGVDATARAGLESTWRGFVKSFFPDLARLLLNGKAGETFGALLDFEALPPSSVASSESLSVTTSSQHGQTLRHTRHCKNGRCETSTAQVTDVDALEEERQQQQQEEEEEPGDEK